MRVIKMKVDRRRSKEKMLHELETLLEEKAVEWCAKKKNPHAMYENTYAAGVSEAMNHVQFILRDILEKGR